MISKSVAGYEADKLLSDGTTAIKDLVSGVAFTMIGGVSNAWTETANFRTLLGVTAPVIAQATTNLLTYASDNSTFEGGTTGTWADDGLTPAIEAVEAWHGTKSMKGTVAAGNKRATLDITAVSSVAAYTLSCWVKAGTGSVGDTITLALVGDTSGATSGTAVTLTSSWQQAKVTKTFAAGDTTLRSAYITSNGSANDIVYIDAVQLETGSIVTPYACDSADDAVTRTACTQTIATPFAAGSPISIICVVNTPWAGDDGVLHFLVNQNSTGANAIYIRKDAANTIGVVTRDNASTAKTKSKAVTSTNWAANTNHIIIATIAADNTLQIFLDGVEGTTSVGTSGRESSVAADLYIGARSTGTSPLNGAILCAMWGRVLSGAEITALSSLAAWSTLTDITLDGLATGNAVRVYDGAAVIDSAVEAGGSVTLTPSGDERIIRVYEDATYGTLLDELVGT
jgi:hypothetical protein